MQALDIMQHCVHKKKDNAQVGVSTLPLMQIAYHQENHTSIISIGQGSTFIWKIHVFYFSLLTIVMERVLERKKNIVQAS